MDDTLAAWLVVCSAAAALYFWNVDGTALGGLKVATWAKYFTTVGSVRKNGPFPAELFFDWILLGGLLIVSRIHFISYSS